MRHANDRIRRRAYFMGHLGEKNGLGQYRRLCLHGEVFGAGGGGLAGEVSLA